MFETYFVTHLYTFVLTPSFYGFGFLFSSHGFLDQSLSISSLSLSILSGYLIFCVREKLFAF